VEGGGGRQRRMKDKRPVLFLCKVCGTICTSAKDLPRFLRRHPKLCSEGKGFTKQLAQGVRSVEEAVDDLYADLYE
jgi:hypothetical protein